jgi:hypothetical protein
VRNATYPPVVEPWPEAGHRRGTPHVENSRLGQAEQDVPKLYLDALARDGA